MLGGSRFSAPYRCAGFDCSVSFSPCWLLDAGVLAGAAAGVDELDELDRCRTTAAGVEAGDEELSDEPAFDDELEPPRLSVL